MWDRQTGAWAQAANKDTSCGGSYAFGKARGTCLNASRYLGRAWANFWSFGGPKSRNANEAHFRTLVDVTG
eukprot:3373785-Alexandrium_andersonii.AAC.1